MEFPEKSYGLSIGGGGLMQALPFWLADKNAKAGQPIDPIAVLSISNSPEGSARVANYNALKDDGYKVNIQGVENGQEVSKTDSVTIVKGALDGGKPDEFEQARQLMADGKITYITSNTHNKGFGEKYPAILTDLLRARFEAKLDPISVFPLELVPQNGKILKERVLAAAQTLTLDQKDDFIKWLNRTPFFNTLVDRIVDVGKDGALAAKTEPFASLVIEDKITDETGKITSPIRSPIRSGQAKAPFGKSSEIELVDNIQEYENRKLGILNCLHTAMVQKWVLDGSPDPEHMNVREFLKKNERWVQNLVDEIVPAVQTLAPHSDVQKYAEQIIERFKNPSINHLLKNIFDGHATKLDVRVNFVRNAAKDKGLDTPELDNIMRGYNSTKPLREDMKAALEKSQKPELLATVENILNAAGVKGVLTDEQLTKALFEADKKISTALQAADRKIALQALNRPAQGYAVA